MNDLLLAENETPRVSIIVPVYNVEQYLRQCIDSLITQTLEEIEIILVDDGSTDGSGRICDEYAGKDPRIRVIHKANEGLSCARNDGMAVSSAPYVLFVDSDDWVEPGYCEIPYRLAEEKGADLVIFQYRVFDEKKREHSIKFEDPPGILSKESAMCFADHSGSMVVWNKLFRRDLISGIPFIPGRFFEDNLFTPEAVDKSERICYTDQKLYNHQWRAGSITRQYHEQADRDFYEIHKLAGERIRELGYPDTAEKYLAKRMWLYRMKYGRNAIYAKECTEYLLSCPERIRLLSRKARVMCIVLRISPGLFDMLCSILKKR